MLGKGSIGQRALIIVGGLSSINLQIVTAGNLPVVGQMSGFLPLQAIVLIVGDVGEGRADGRRRGAVPLIPKRLAVVPIEFGVAFAGVIGVAQR